jgi:hypothetical protein
MKKNIEKTSEKDINISSFVDIELRKYFTLLQGRIYNAKEEDGLGRIRTGGLRRVRAMS